MADTRKDKRAPISLKVRFKSATLDEFIEQYSADISRGGIFIKSKTPMSVGTLLKFEFQLKDESRLIHGVGRVVWKREAGEGNDPPGMGIKFIKMDPESRTLVDQMVKQRGDAPGRFDAGSEHRQAAPSGGQGGGNFFPSTTPESELPAPEDRTQVRHASEFLASALAEGDASASAEAERKAEEARKRTEEIERQRAEEAKKKRKPRIKKTLVGMGIPAAGESGDLESEEMERPGAAAGEEAPRELSGHRAAREGRAPLDDAAATTPDLDRQNLHPSPGVAAASEAEETLAAEADPLARKHSGPEVAGLKDSESPKGRERERQETSGRGVSSREPAVGARTEAARKPVEEKRPALRVAPADAMNEEEPRSRAGMILFALVAAAAIGVIVWMRMDPDGLSFGTSETPVAAEPPDAPVEDEPVEGDTLAEGEGEDELGSMDEGEDVEEEEAAVETVAIRVETRPEGATILVDGEEQGTAPGEVEVPLGRAVTVSARMDGFSTASQEVTASEDTAPVRLTLEALPYVISVVTEPAGALVRGGGGRVNGPGEIRLRSRPTEPIELSATHRRHERAQVMVAPSAFVEREGRMVATVQITLEEERSRQTATATQQTGTQQAATQQTATQQTAAQQTAAQQTTDSSVTTPGEGQAGGGASDDAPSTGTSSGGSGGQAANQGGGAADGAEGSGAGTEPARERTPPAGGEGSGGGGSSGDPDAPPDNPFG